MNCIFILLSLNTSNVYYGFIIFLQLLCIQIQRMTETGGSMSSS